MLPTKKLLFYLFAAVSILTAVFYVVAISCVNRMQNEMNRKRTEAARSKRWSREPEPGTERETETQENFQPLTIEPDEKNEALA